MTSPRTLSIAFLSLSAGLAVAGPINPPSGPVVSTGKTLAEVEPAVAINTTNTPGDSDSQFRITQPGSYYLTGNITGVNGKAGIEVAASGVTIDLRGFAMTGVSGSLQGVVVVGTGVQNVAVRNGTLTAWGLSAVDTFAGTQCEVESIRASLNGGAGVRGGLQNVVRRCTVAQNAGWGITAQTNSIVEGCHATENLAGGFQVQSNTVVSGCCLVGSSSSIGIDALNGCTLSGCSVQLFFTGIQTANDCTVTACTSRSNAGPGINAGSGTTVSNCTAGANTTDGIRVSTNCHVYGNNCRQNGFGAGVGAGIHATGADNRIEANNCTTADTGIDVDVAGNFITRNTCSGNFVNNWDLAPGNYCLVVAGVTPGTAIVGNAGGVSPGSSDPNANYTY